VNEGKNLWAMANSVFDYLPFAATIDDVIFCVHGGIPRPLSAEETALESINKIPCPTAVRVTTTDARSKQIKQLSSDLLWSDPAQHEQEKRLDQTGFGEGERGPGAICYGDKAIQNFLDINGMSHIVRAHEPTQKGINISKGGRVITIFSTSQVPMDVNSED
jgi:serine/threonine-protein phosphatase